MHFFSVLTFAISAAAYALPVTSSVDSLAKTKTFGLSMSVGVGDARKNLTLHARPNGSFKDSLILVGCGESPADKGTRFFASGNGSTGTATINAIYHGNSTYGLSAADVGDNYGIHVPVDATKGYSDPEWFVGGGQIFHKLYAGSNLLMACNQTINGEVKPVLNFGVVNSNGTIPYGCGYTTVYTV